MLYKHHNHQTYSRQILPLLDMPYMNQRLNPAKVFSVTSCLIPPTM